MLKKFVSDSGKDWDKWLPYLLFAYREVPQASTGFSPFELLYAHQVRGPLDVLKESWEATDNPKRKNITHLCDENEGQTSTEYYLGTGKPDKVPRTAKTLVRQDGKITKLRSR